MTRNVFSRIGSLFTYLVIIVSVLVTGCEDKTDPASEQVALKACGTCGTFPVCCSASSDPDGDGWGWEENASCIVNGTAAQRQQCSGGISNGCTGTTINPFTQVNTGAWQNVATASVSAGATVRFGPQPSTGGSWRWTGPNGFSSTSREITITNVQSGTAGNYIATYTNASNCASTRTFTITIGGSNNPGTGGFTISGNQLRDANGNNFIMKGVNVPLAWFVSDVNNNIANIRTRTGSNTLRIVVSTSTADADWQTAVTRTIANRMIPMVELHSVTGSNSTADLQRMAEWWASKASFLRRSDIARYILVNIANEWGDWFMASPAHPPAETVWRDAYINAVRTIRNAGINTTIVVDAPGYGQDNRAFSLLNYADDVQAADPRHNVLFSVHMYCEWRVGGSSNISTLLPQIKNSGIPIIVGEFGFQHASDGSCDINEQLILDTAQANGIGWLAWSWKGNGSSVAYLDLSRDWAGTSLTAWGNTIVNGRNGTRTASTASVFN